MEGTGGRGFKEPEEATPIMEDEEEEEEVEEEEEEEEVGTKTSQFKTANKAEKGAMRLISFRVFLYFRAKKNSEFGRGEKILGIIITRFRGHSGRRLQEVTTRRTLHTAAAAGATTTAVVVNINVVSS